jgi:hypothetical protein
MATRHTTYASPTRSGLGRWHGAALRCVGTLSWQQPDSSVRPNERFLAPFSAPVPIRNVSSERAPFDLVDFVSSVNFVPFGTSILMWTSGFGTSRLGCPKGEGIPIGKGRGGSPPSRRRSPPRPLGPTVTSAKVGSQSPGTRPA